MRYLIRSIKTFLYFTLIFIVIVAVFVISGMTEFNIETMFRDGYKSLWQILAIMVVIAAVYPKLNYVKSFPGIKGNLGSNRVQISEIMHDFGYVEEKESVEKMTFRQIHFSARLSRKFEDRITFEQDGDRISVEGLRKDIVRIVSRMEYRLGND